MAVDTSSVLEALDEFAPRDLAEEWDNVGLLVGSSSGPLGRVMTCLTLTPDVAREAVRERVELIITHHPLIFRAIKRVTDRSVEGRTLLELIRHGIRVYSPHTGYDSALGGINAQLAQAFSLRKVKILRVREEDKSQGAGRLGELAEPMSLRAFVEVVKRALRIDVLQYVGDLDQEIRRVAIACGAADEFTRDAEKKGCDAILLGEARFHTALAAPLGRACNDPAGPLRFGAAGDGVSRPALGKAVSGPSRVCERRRERPDFLLGVSALARRFAATWARQHREREP